MVLKLGKTVSIMGRVRQLSTTMSTTTKTTSPLFTIQKKSKLSSYVVAAGVQYGMGENLLHYFFKVHLNYITWDIIVLSRHRWMFSVSLFPLAWLLKTSWLGEFAKVPVFGPGTNIIPTIHVNDLAGFVSIPLSWCSIIAYLRAPARVWVGKKRLIIWYCLLLSTRVIQNVIDHKPKIHYFLAMDDSNNTFEDIVKVNRLSQTDILLIISSW